MSSMKEQLTETLADCYRDTCPGEILTISTVVDEYLAGARSYEEQTVYWLARIGVALVLLKYIKEGDIVAEAADGGHSLQLVNVHHKNCPTVTECN